MHSATGSGPGRRLARHVVGRSWWQRGLRGTVVGAVVVAIVAAIVGFGGPAGAAAAVGNWSATLSPVGTQPVPAGDALEYSYQVQCSTPGGCGTITGCACCIGAPGIIIGIGSG